MQIQLYVHVYCRTLHLTASGASRHRSLKVVASRLDLPQLSLGRRCSRSHICCETAAAAGLSLWYKRAKVKLSMHCVGFGCSIHDSTSGSGMCGGGECPHPLTPSLNGPPSLPHGVALDGVKLFILPDGGSLVLCMVENPGWIHRLGCPHVVEDGIAATCSSPPTPSTERQHLPEPTQPSTDNCKTGALLRFPFVGAQSSQ